MVRKRLENSKKKALFSLSPHPDFPRKGGRRLNGTIYCPLSPGGRGLGWGGLVLNLSQGPLISNRRQALYASCNGEQTSF